MIYELNTKYAVLKPLVEDIESYFDASTRVLYDQRNVIRIINFENKDYVVKAFKTPNLVNRFAYRYLRPSKARRSYQYSLKIGPELTPEAVAYIEDIQNGLLGKSYYISEYFAYDFTIHQVLMGKEIKHREQVLKEFADFSYELHELEILHHDYSHGNILIKIPINNASPHSFKIIDINRMAFKRLDLPTRLKNFARINADDDDMQIIIGQYAQRIEKPIQDLLKQAKHYRDKFYRKRELVHKLRGKA